METCIDFAPLKYGQVAVIVVYHELDYVSGGQACLDLCFFFVRQGQQTERVEILVHQGNTVGERVLKSDCIYDFASTEVTPSFLRTSPLEKSDIAQDFRQHGEVKPSTVVLLSETIGYMADASSCSQASAISRIESCPCNASTEVASTHTVGFHHLVLQCIRVFECTVQAFL